MEYGIIEREIHVEASPDIVYDVVSRPEHLREWWPDDVKLDPVPGAVGELIWHGDDGVPAMVVPMTVVEAEPPRRFSFRWVYDADAVPDESNSFLVTFDLVPTDNGTTVRMTETGFRERGWEIAVLEAAYNEHIEGWNRFVPRLADYITRLATT
ncbi:activator of HSP90 ATPase [Catellatospora sp. TT07R-123]|uniref:SRPBCC domain-containing protein n=1 Tax=Catellatospora sp. TT07R-123 TaxID=2733863 RepID=UPI001B1DACF9|nr:SRPBCC domain-containing protein [Catellatospora sp. TT07R-123]GHJ43596.1 activator of HSP90 ATPase [Catellatospora sp. TT07R-123]